jgi:DegV family protein with EDD domain
LTSTISLVTDSTSDVPPEFVRRFNIRSVPSLVVIDGKPYRDGVEMTREEFYQRLRTFDLLPTTATPASGDFEAVYRSCPDGPIISIHTAATLSGLYNAARVGAEPLSDRVTMIDSGSLSLGVGWQLIAAGEAIEAGKPLPQVLEVIVATRRRLKVYAILDTLENLRRSGRMSLLKTSIANVLQIKPIIELAEGGITAVAQNRTMKKAMADFLARVRALGRLERLAVMYTDDPALASEVSGALADQCPSPPLVAQAAPTIGTHIGPGAVAVAVVTIG